MAVSSKRRRIIEEQKKAPEPEVEEEEEEEEEHLDEDDEEEEEEGAESESGANGSSGLQGVVAVGTYDGALLGFSADDGSQKFGFSSHVGCVKAIHCSKQGKMASGGTDQSVRLFDISKNVELGELQEHQDSVSCVQFWGQTSLITSGDDGYVCIWRAADWDLLLKFKAHRTNVACIAIHPSGRLMATAGRDQTLKLWDLTRGTSAASLTIEETAESLEWSAGNGDRMLAVGPKALLVVDARSGAVCKFCDPNSAGFLRVSLNAATFLGGGKGSPSAVIVGDGKGDLRILAPIPPPGKTADLQEAFRLPADAKRGRVKALVACSSHGEAGTFAAGMSNGRVEIWRYETVRAASAFALLLEVDTGVRLTCMSAWCPTEKEVAADAEVVKKRMK